MLTSSSLLMEDEDDKEDDRFAFALDGHGRDFFKETI